MLNFEITCHRAVTRIARLTQAPLVVALALLAPAGSSAGPIEFHGYGEFHYSNPRTGTMDQSAASEADAHRFVLGWSYDFRPDLRLDAEIDFEHAAEEIELEYAHLDYDVGPTVSIRVGSVLVPVGPLNEFHEPPLFHSVERPYVEQSVIPTTWQEIGVGVVGRAADGALGYRAYVVAGLDASGFSTLNGIRGGRSHGAESKAEDLAGVARVEYATAAGLTLAGSGYFGGADQTVDGPSIHVGIVEADGRYRRGRIDLRAMIARTMVEGAAFASALAGEPVGKAMQGWYGEAAYDLLDGGAEEGAPRSLFVFLRREDYDTHHEVASGVTREPAASRGIWSGGLSFRPDPRVAFKADLEHWRDGAEETLNRFNVSAAFQF